MKALIDADIIAYRAAAKAARDGLTEAWAVLTEATNEIQEWTGLAAADEFILIFSPEDRSNYRKHLGDHYKAHRSEKPPTYDEVVYSLKREYDWYAIDGLEADDVMGILNTSPVTGDTIIVSIDKDMLTIPGNLMNPNKMKFPAVITEAEADYNWFYQTLIGDVADGFKGCLGIGPKKAEAALKPLLDEYLLQEMDHIGTNIPFSAICWPTVLDFFLAKSQYTAPFEEALLNARMARILRRSDYSLNGRLVRLWHPETPLAWCLDTMKVVGEWHDLD